MCVLELFLLQNILFSTRAAVYFTTSVKQEFRDFQQYCKNILYKPLLHLGARSLKDLEMLFGWRACTLYYKTSVAKLSSKNAMPLTLPLAVGAVPSHTPV